MTDQMPIVTKGAARVRFARDALAPPRAPLAMPKQVLQARHSLIARAVGAVLARLALLKHGFRRAG